MFESLGRLHSSLDELPDAIKEVETDEEMIEIDGKKYIRRIFEAIVEAGYDSFIGNLELETILDSKDNDAEKPVGEFKLL
jgi:hypothetical protein